MIKIGIATMSALMLVLTFQNCGKKEEPKYAGDKVIGTTELYSKVTHDPHLEQKLANVTAGTDSNRPRLRLDFSSGVLEIVNSEGVLKTCLAGPEVLANFDEILKDGTVCSPGPVPAGTAICMGMAMADVKLENEKDSLLLRRKTCNNGTYLCGDDDAKLRALLNDLYTHPPVDCQ